MYYNRERQKFSNAKHTPERNLWTNAPCAISLESNEEIARKQSGYLIILVCLLLHSFPKVFYRMKFWLLHQLAATSRGRMSWSHALMRMWLGWFLFSFVELLRVSSSPFHSCHYLVRRYTGTIPCGHIVEPHNVCFTRDNNIRQYKPVAAIWLPNVISAQCALMKSWEWGCRRKRELRKI